MADDFPRRPDTSSFLFASTFQGEDALRTGEWVLSEDPKYEGQASRVRVERCDLEGGKFYGDYGLLLEESHKHYGVGASLPKPIDNAGKDLVLQYEVQVRGGAGCGGAYVKMLRGPEGEDMITLTNESPYSVMFGPDKCFRDTNKVHFIFQHENPNTKEWEEKHFENAPKMKDDGGFHLYTLHIKTDNTFDVYVDAEMVSSGNLLEDMAPPLIPPEEIDDPEDKQPEDWVTKAKIPDPTAVKPDDWDEDAPRKIVDEEAEMPDGWLEDEQELIEDPSASRPDDWDDEEDGEWHAPLVVNEACKTAPGCGEWEKPMIANPAYKGTWSPPKIDNPEYKGKWAPRKIANPAYFKVEDTQPSNMAPITGLALEIWTVDGGVWFDNFVVGDDVGNALKLGEETWRPKFEKFEAAAAVEREQKEKEMAKKRRERDASQPSALLKTSRLLAEKARPILPDAAAPALQAASENPVAVIATILSGLLAVVLMSVVRRRSRSSASGRNAQPAASADAAAAAAAPDDDDGGDANDDVDVQEGDDGPEEDKGDAAAKDEDGGEASGASASDEGEPKEAPIAST